nr:hypothetical protein [Tanacetum cinerariifolium]
MGEPLSPDHVFDFSVDEPELHAAYDFFTPGPLPGYAVDEIAEPVDKAEEQVITLVVGMDEDISMLFGDDDFEDGDFSNDDSEGVEEEEEVWEVNEEWLMALITRPSVPAVQPSSVYEVGGPSTAAEGLYFFLLAPGLPIPPSVIEDLSPRLGNLEHEYRQLVKKVIQVSDAEVAASVSIGEIGSRVFDMEGQMQVMASQMVHAADRWEQLSQRHADSAAAGYSFIVEQPG